MICLSTTETEDIAQEIYNDLLSTTKELKCECGCTELEEFCTGLVCTRCHKIVVW